MRYMDEDLEDDLGHRRFDATTALVVKCFATHGLRLDVDAVRRWSEEEEAAANAWIDGEGAAPAPPVIAAARAEYADARKCRRCGPPESGQFGRCRKEPRGNRSLPAGDR